MSADILIVGAGPGGMAAALSLHAAGIPCRVFEAAPEVRPIGLGINLLPHATKVFADLGLEAELARRAVTTKESVFFSRFGQLIHREPAGRHAGFAHPQFSIHRADLQDVLIDAFRARAGTESLVTGHLAVAVEQDASGATVHFNDPKTGARLPSARGRAAIACDGLHSPIRKQFHPEEGEPLYSGVNMWRGAVLWPRFLTGASMVRAGWLSTGKMVIYPIRDAVDDAGRQLVNWVAEIETPRHKPKRDWNKPGRVEDFIGAFADWRFDWLDVPAMIRATPSVLEFPMIDQDPLTRWTFGRVTLLGDAAHPMYPRGSNGAVQAILDARALADALKAHGADVEAALRGYEAIRLPATSKVVLTNRTTPPDAILREVFLRTGDKPFARIDDVISREELMALSDGYKKVSGQLGEPPA